MVISVSSPPVAVAASRAWAHCRTHSRLWGTLKTGGESGIRTHVRVSPKHAFQACAFSHSAISPALCPERTHHALGKKEAAAIGRSTEQVCLSILWGRDGGSNWPSAIAASLGKRRNGKFSHTSAELRAES